jgi:D-alanyl-D-alanine carboxypeptidase/D-alanyl-D-alanine-endopeptidase (penicillin-binding protein 4)
LKYKIIIFLLGSALAASLIFQWRERRAVGIAPGAVSSPTTERYAELALAVDQPKQRLGLGSAAMGFCLLDSKGNVVLDRSARTAFIPASSLKTVTTATALEMLGPDFRFETIVRATASMAQGVLSGDVIIVGGADPMLSLQDVRSWAQNLKSRGLRRIAGRIIGDGRVLPGTMYNDFWNWGDIGNGYGSGVSGLNLQHNRFEAVFDAGSSEGAPARFLKVEPEVPGVHWIHEVITGSTGSGDGVMIHGGERTGVVFLRGTVPLGAEGFAIAGAVPEPEWFAAHHLREAMKAEGIVVEGEAMSMFALRQKGEELNGASETLLTHRSPPLLEIVTSIHASSDNHETECVFRMLGVRAKKPPDVVVREHWRARGLEFEGLRMEDGCGLARADFIRPVDLAKLQYLAGRGPQGEAYKNSLRTREDGAYRWKGGAMSGVRSTTGYVVGVSGEEFCFAFIVNHYTDGEAVSEMREELMEAMRKL